MPFIHSAADGLNLPVMEQFYTVQGEGFHAGSAAYFIRLAGCDVGCHWCDVKESWHTSGYPILPVEALADAPHNDQAPAVVITGGEPLLHNLAPLTAALQRRGIQTWIETSGSSPLSGHWNWICLSPKKFKHPIPEVVEAADELKVIVFNDSDFDFAERFQAQVKPGCKLYLQPEWGRMHAVMPTLVAYVKSNPSWHISLQNHKFMEIP